MDPKKRLQGTQPQDSGKLGDEKGEGLVRAVFQSTDLCVRPSCDNLNLARRREAGTKLGTVNWGGNFQVSAQPFLPEDIDHVASSTNSLHTFPPRNGPYKRKEQPIV